MARFRLTLPILCSMILAAHFLREQSLGLTLACLLAIPLLFVRSSWSAIGLRLFFILAAVEWARTAALLVMERVALGLPWVRMVLILGAVIVISLGSAWMISSGDRPVRADA